MTITQTLDITASRQISVPDEVPLGPATIIYMPAVTKPLKERVFGCSKGKYRLDDDFFEPLEDFKDYM